MAISKETIEYVAHLARIDLSGKELEKLSSQLKDILDFIDKLKKIDTKDISPTSHILDIQDALREDNLKESLPVDRTLQNAPQQEKNFFVVPKVIE
ncbi:MAG: Asp-tRNA(Asn)/Glu-tRNA(Gln) amidotransferase subunit GatC [Candidatus Omnitrophica bacterium]|nr:Asp-tRNA(Asn)/Glu-tRNA(Gln) amidotransferase subunit GatC [Candidatus Omnitrophota bacterium]